MSKPIIGITGNEREIPDDHFIHMSYTATGFVEGVKEVGGIPMILPIGDEEMAKQEVKMYALNSMVKRKPLTAMIIYSSETFLS